LALASNANGPPLGVWKYIDGEQLDCYWQSQIQTASLLRQLMAQIATCVQQLHAHGLVHGDLKPSNIIVNKTGCATVIDFDASRWILEASGSPALFFDPVYTAPEVFSQAGSDQRADVFSLGRMLKELLNDLPERDLLLETIVAKATKSSPEARYQSALQFANALRDNEEAAMIKVGDSPAVATSEQHFMELLQAASSVAESDDLKCYQTADVDLSLLTSAVRLIDDRLIRAADFPPKSTRTVAQVLWCHATHLRGHAKITLAIQYANKALFVQAQICLWTQTDHFEAGHWKNETCDMISSLNLHREAMNFSDGAFVSWSRILPENDPLLNRLRNNKANLFRKMGQLRPSRILYEKAVCGWREELGEFDTEYAWGLHNLGHISRLEGKFQEALDHTLKALRLKRNLLGEDHPETAFMLNNLGQISGKLQNVRDAKNYFNQAILLRTKSLGPFHPSTLLSVNLYLDYLRQEESQEAKKFAQKYSDFDPFTQVHSETVILCRHLAEMGSGHDRYAYLEMAQVIEAELHSACNVFCSSFPML
jgi:serine/threonine protein kinase